MECLNTKYSIHPSQNLIKKEEYEFVKKTWLGKGWSTLKDMLIYYNLLDYAPFVTAVGNLLVSYKQQNLDIFKRAFSVSGVTKLQMMQRFEKDAFFVCIKTPQRFIENYAFTVDRWFECNFHTFGYCW